MWSWLVIRYPLLVIRVVVFGYDLYVSKNIEMAHMPPYIKNHQLSISNHQ